MNITVKRVYELPARTDGMRILVDRLWPRGLRKDIAALDAWHKELAPSTELRQWFDHQAERFAEFKHRYLVELAANKTVPAVLADIGKHRATLLYAAHDTQINHAVVLAQYMIDLSGGISVR